MYKIGILILFTVSFFANAERIKLPENKQAMSALSELTILRNEINSIKSLSKGMVDLIHITSKYKGIREDLRINEEYNSGILHKFMFESVDGTQYCDFSIYVIYQHTTPLSINKKFTKVTSKASCH